MSMKMAASVLLVHPSRNCQTWYLMGSIVSEHNARALATMLSCGHWPMCEADSAQLVHVLNPNPFMQFHLASSFPSLGCALLSVTVGGLIHEYRRRTVCTCSFYRYFAETPGMLITLRCHCCVFQGESLRFMRRPSYIRAGINLGLGIRSAR